MKSLLISTILVTFLALMLFDSINSGHTGEEHWNFICSSSNETLKDILDCYFDRISPDVREAHERLQQCTEMSQLEIIREHCINREFKTTGKESLIHSCYVKESKTFRRKPDEEEKPSQVVSCVESLPSFQAMKDRE
uniref:Venom protein n=1 Tax=Hadrurus spadix TaxID=141984 RepID=A0A1W7R984_9SCOR